MISKLFLLTRFFAALGQVGRRDAEDHGSHPVGGIVVLVGRALRQIDSIARLDVEPASLSSTIEFLPGKPYVQFALLKVKTRVASMNSYLRFLLRLQDNLAKGDQVGAGHNAYQDRLFFSFQPPQDIRLANHFEGVQSDRPTT